MAEIVLDRPRVLAVVGKLIAGGDARHMWVDRELDAGLPPGPARPTIWRTVSLVNGTLHSLTNT